jgi:gamma-glutamyltranspeptidase/glutathione hydrolase
VAGTIAFSMRRQRAFPETMRTFLHSDGNPLAPAGLSRRADRLVQPELGRTLRLLADEGAGALYEGDLGAQIVADLQANGGVLTREDFASFRLRELHTPLEASYRGHTLLGVPGTAGCVTAYQALNLLERFDLKKLGPGSAESTHLIVEALRRAFLDRFEHLADPDTERVPFDGVLSKAYAAELADQIDPRRATPSASAGDPWRFDSNRPGSARGPRSTVAGSDTCTTHLTVVDRDRNVVSLTSTLGETFGSAVVARGTGILLNNGMTWFNPEPGQVNSLEAGKRIFWAPSPTIVLRDGRPLLALGAPGGRRIISAIVQSLVNLLDFELGIQEAVSAPRVHCEGSLTEAEARLEPALLEELASRGHRLEVMEETATSFSFARPNGIRIDPATNRLTGGVNQFVPAWAMGHDT